MKSQEIVQNLPQFITSEGLVVHKKFKDKTADYMAHMLGDILLYGNGIGLASLCLAYPDADLINKLVRGINYLTIDGYPHRTWIADMDNLTPETIADEMWYNLDDNNLDLGFRGDTSYSQFFGACMGLVFAVETKNNALAKKVLESILVRFWDYNGVLYNLEGERNPHSHWAWVGSNGLVVLTLHYISEWLGIDSGLWSSTVWLLKRNINYLDKIHKSEKHQDSINLCFLCFLILKLIENDLWGKSKGLHSRISITNPLFDLVADKKDTWQKAYDETSLFLESDYLWKDTSPSKVLDYQYNSRLDLLLLKGIAETL